MRRFAVVLAGLLAAGGVLAAPAFATFHLTMVNEVMLASGAGDQSVQFVEFLDHGGSEEAFTPVFAPYKLVVYDAAGHKLGEQQLSADGLRGAASADREYLVSTAAADAAFGVAGDERLGVQLPAGAGQACFEANTSPSAVSCMTWGTITSQVATNSQGTGPVHGPVPPNGQSDQRLADNSVVAAPPTPKARNHAAAGTPGGGGPTFAGMGFGKRTIAVGHAGHVAVRLSCPKGASRCSGTLTLTTTGHRHKRLARGAFNIAAGTSTKVTVTLNAAGRRMLAKARRLKVRAVAAAHDGAGHSANSAAKIVLAAR